MPKRRKKWSTAAIVVGLFLGLALIGGEEPGPPLPQCSDNVDNDGDGLSDSDDPNCQFVGDITIYCPNWDSETQSPPLSECV